MSKRKPEREPEREYVYVDGLRLPLPTPEEEAVIIAAALSDPDNPPLTDEELVRMRPAKKRGRPTKAVPKVLITLRLDPEIVDHFRGGGKSWQTRINETLMAAIEKQKAVPKARKPAKAKRRPSARSKTAA